MPEIRPNAPGAAPTPPGWRRFRPGSEAFSGWLFVAPALVGFLAFFLIPTIRAFSIGLTQWTLLSPARWVGLENYRRILDDAAFWESIRVTGRYVLYNIPAQVVLAMLLALLLDRFGRSVALRSVVLLPFLISNVVVAMIWYWMLDPVLGWGSVLLEFLGFERQPFFSGASQALPTVAAVNVWRHFGFNALLFYTGLQAIPPYLYEAARIEGAGAWRTFWSVTLPLLRPIVVFVLVTSVIGSFQIFDTIAVTTQGGPGSATRSVVWYIYVSAFGSFRMGYASAMSCVLFLGLICVTLLQLRLLRAGQSDLG